MIVYALQMKCGGCGDVVDAEVTSRADADVWIDGYADSHNSCADAVQCSLSSGRIGLISRNDKHSICVDGGVGSVLEA